MQIFGLSYGLMTAQIYWSRFSYALRYIVSFVGFWEPTRSMLRLLLCQIFTISIRQEIAISSGCFSYGNVDSVHKQIVCQQSFPNWLQERAFMLYEQFRKQLGRTGGLKELLNSFLVLLLVPYSRHNGGRGRENYLLKKEFKNQQQDITYTCHRIIALSSKIRSLEITRIRDKLREYLLYKGSFYKSISLLSPSCSWNWYCPRRPWPAEHRHGFRKHRSTVTIDN